LRTAPAQPPQEAVNLPSGPSPAMPSTPAPKVNVPRGTTAGDQAELSRKLSTGSGISQIAGKVENSGLLKDHPVLGKILGIGAQGLAQIGDIGLRAVAPAVDLAIPGTSLHHLADVRGDQRQVAQDTENEGRQATAQETRARIPLTQATTAKTVEETNELPGKTASEEGLQGAEAQKDLNPADTNPDMATYRSLVKLGMRPNEALQEIEKDKALALKPSGMEKGDLVGPDGKPMAANYNPSTGKWTDTTGKEIANPKPYEKPNEAGMITMIAPDPNTPGGGIVQRLGAGAKIAPGSQTAAGVSSMNTPTTNQRTAAGRAETVIAMAPEVLARIDAVAPKLGPIAGRWNEFMQGKVGNSDPDFSALRSDLLMMSSAVALAHAQGRLPENLREEFDRAINAPKQTPANLKATIQTMIPWLQKVQDQGGRSGTQPQESSPTRPSNVPDGYTFNANGPKGAGWYAPTKTTK
jgi:hypothetical protein